ncbi:MAG: acyl dehydratase [Halioglobus sp.]|jgi:acyl dehydratase
MRYFEDFEAGSVYPLEGRHQFSEEDIIEFATRWDPQPFHIDSAAAAESIFGGIVACSSHIIAAAISVASDESGEPSAAISALGFKEIKMAAPVRPDDVIRSEEQVLETRLSKSRPGAGIVSFRNDIYNQNNEMVATFQTAALMKCRGGD